MNKKNEINHKNKINEIVKIKQHIYISKEYGGEGTKKNFYLFFAKSLIKRKRFTFFIHKQNEKLNQFNEIVKIRIK